MIETSKWKKKYVVLKKHKKHKHLEKKAMGEQYESTTETNLETFLQYRSTKTL